MPTAVEKIKNVKELRRLIAELRAKHKKVIFTNGCFDLLHYGHVKYLEDASSLGDLLVVGLNSDISVRRIKGEQRPIVSEIDRAKVIAALQSVDYVVIFNEDTPLKIIKLLKPDVLVKGADWSKKDIVGSDFVCSYGGKVKTLKLVKGRSTSGLINKIVHEDEVRVPILSNGVYRVIDANINRVKEGLRVCEEITRFILNDPRLSRAFKRLRHRIDAAAENLPATTELFKSREALRDVGKSTSVSEIKRRNLKDIFFANIQRAKESLRVLEEFSKLLVVDAALDFKKIRYVIYELEKRIAQKMLSLRYPG